MDFNITFDEETNEKCLKDVIKRAFEFNYECIAINTFIPSSKLSGKNISIPEPKNIDIKLPLSRNFKIMNRLTAVVEDGIHAHHLMKHPNTKKYDILAMRPVGEKMLQHVCNQLDVDIISLDFTEYLNFRVKRSHVSPAIQKGTCLEISYAPCLRDRGQRLDVISNAQQLVEILKGKNIVVSSGAMKPLELRSVEDVTNLALLFGFKRNEAVAAVRETGRRVISHAETRTKTGCGFVSMSGLHKLPKHQGWIVKICKAPKMSNVASSSKSENQLKFSTTKHSKDDVSQDNASAQVKVEESTEKSNTFDHKGFFNGDRSEKNVRGKKRKKGKTAAIDHESKGLSDLEGSLMDVTPPKDPHKKIKV